MSEQLERLGLPSELVLGAALERGGVFFDPGRMGSYFQSPASVRSNLRLLSAAAATARDSEAIEQVRRMLEPAAERGLYVTF